MTQLGQDDDVPSRVPLDRPRPDRSAPARFLLDLCAIARPWFWPVSLLPYYVGFLLASHRLLPTAAQLPHLLTGAIVVEPLVWLAVLAINDAHDLPGDLLNPRKAGTPLTSGRLSVRQVRRIALAAAGTALLVSLSIGAAFAAGALLALTLGWLYSAPPVRLKSRPGADVTANALALGALGPLAGWTAVHLLAGFPWPISLQGVLVRWPCGSVRASPTGSGSRRGRWRPACPLCSPPPGPSSPGGCCRSRRSPYRGWSSPTTCCCAGTVQSRGSPW